MRLQAQPISDLEELASTGVQLENNIRASHPRGDAPRPEMPVQPQDPQVSITEDDVDGELHAEGMHAFGAR